ncbi:MAG: hypothetical protein N4A43_01260 [Alphaproteobacteria bacterium]|jgi:diphthamide synthase subunit DPH2|nr:hypothetical protein [Alphaproteobacteria bacterium]
MQKLSVFHAEVKYKNELKETRHGICNPFIKKWIVKNSEEVVKTGEVMGCKVYVAVHNKRKVYYTKDGNRFIHSSKKLKVHRSFLKKAACYSI